MGSHLVAIKPVIDYSVRELCTKPYPLHPKGCPNVNKCERCPPQVPLFEEIFDLTKPVYAVINEFNLDEHVAKMQAKQPSWTDRQLRCVLYWQPKARKELGAKVKEALNNLAGYVVTNCPEGMGVNVTETLSNVGIELEWPPMQIARQVAFLGYPKGV